MQNAAAAEMSTKTGPRITTSASTALFTKTVCSKDGTAIAFDRIGHGSPVILVDGALCHRGMGESRRLAELLAAHFTVFTYDRRGRGESGETLPYAVEREVEDIAALVSEAGGTAHVWGMSSGAVLALDAANRLSGVTKLALYEAPLIVDDSHTTTEEQWVRIGHAIAAQRRGEAVKVFLQMVGIPGYAIALMQLMPIWSKLKAIAHTLPYDGAIVQDLQRSRPLPANRWAAVTIPTLVMNGGRSAEWMRHGNQSLARILSNAEYRTLDGQTHLLKPAAHAPALVDFFKA